MDFPSNCHKYLRKHSDNKSHCYQADKMRTLKNLINLLFLLLGYLSLRSKRKIVFGAWDGKSYSDNPRFLFEYYFDHPEWQIVWIGNKSVKNSLPPLPKNATYAKRHSLIGLWHALTAKTWVFSHSPNDIAIVAIWGAALLLNTWHGVALKKFGEKAVSYIKHRSVFEAFWKKIFAKKIFLVVPSKIQGTNTLASYPGLFQEPILPYGSAALDYILKNKSNLDLIGNLRSKFAKTFNLPIDKKWVVYAPTFRLTKQENFSFVKITATEMERLQRTLDMNNAILIEKLHPNLIDENGLCTATNIYSINGTKAKLIETHELWLAADAIISDYSSCVIPFYLQNKPVIHFAYDYGFYHTVDSGLIMNLNDIRFGLIAYTISDLCKIMSKLDDAKGQCGKFAHHLIEYEKGNACTQCFNFIEQILSSHDKYDQYADIKIQSKESS